MQEINADLAQLAEQLFCKQQVRGSSPLVGSTENRILARKIERAAHGEQPSRSADVAKDVARQLQEGWEGCMVSRIEDVKPIRVFYS
jgi:hypothetical protein